ncbi:MAG: hypothetical protein UU48_C0006G0122 [Candidatus Uhrbacteria bacterium GW2011_GWF2_41_16]|uniref:Uncharacterized protein n=2 Tax=Candidatus Uhriibacteriota TaxID=1752732 RepID=A0A0G0YCM7_9BACT|nr:MAG: hypothetical protein UU35_C0007G0010 [Candidatus Uhrbacteria bacterium GW2011_GWC2_41_11]KKR98082.1 MAG: hypothetical protein UU48_C0006G0122 [Candidatus Uhrbacteria bacterium GW2011_GWF2_41_16]
MSLEQLKGLLMNHSCPSCKEGRLIGIWNTRCTQTGYSYEVLERLGCNKCSLSFEAEHRGKTPEQIREQALTSFQNPDVCPEQCPVCGFASFQQNTMIPESWRNELEELVYNVISFSRPLLADPREKKTYQYCQHCNTIIFVLPTDPVELEAYEQEKKNLLILRTKFRNQEPPLCAGP